MITARPAILDTGLSRLGVLHGTVNPVRMTYVSHARISRIEQPRTSVTHVILGTAYQEPAVSLTTLAQQVPTMPALRV